MSNHLFTLSLINNLDSVLITLKEEATFIVF